MARTTPQIVGSILNLGSRQIEVGTEAWFTWLIEARSFAYDHGGTSFTARKQQRKGFWYWYAYARRDGQLRCVYLGRSNSLTIERLQTIARALHTSVGKNSDVSPIRGYDGEAKQEGSARGRPEHLYDNHSSQDKPRLNISRVRTDLAEIEVQLGQRGKRKPTTGLQALDLVEVVLQALSDEREQVRAIVTTLRKAMQ